MPTGDVGEEKSSERRRERKSGESGKTSRGERKHPRSILDFTFSSVLLRGHERAESESFKSIQEAIISREEQVSWPDIDPESLALIQPDVDDD